MEFALCALLYAGSLLFWPAFQLLHRRCTPLARRLFVVFAATLAYLLALGSTIVGPFAAANVPGLPLLLFAGNIASVCLSVAILSVESTQRLPRWLWWTTLLAGTAFLLIAAWARLLIDWRHQPVCHKGLQAALEQWRADQNTDAYPNVSGSSEQSLAAVPDFQSLPYIAQAYAYIPGLTSEDPDDLVLFYLKHPTRWVWHSGPKTFFAPKGWLIVPRGFNPSLDSPHITIGECSETVPVQVFRQRLVRTLDFVRTNNRPAWQQVIAEHGRYLDSLPKP